MLKMLAAILIPIFVTSYVTAEIPSYIHICGRRDPNLEQCILNNINNLKDKICQGIPELDVPSIDPMHFPKLIMSNTKNLKIIMTNMQIYGFCDFVINNFHIDLDNLYFNTTILFKSLHINSTYNINVHLLVPIATKGQIAFTTENVNVDTQTQMKITTKGDKRYIYFSNVILNIDIDDYTSQYHSDDILDHMEEVINNIGANNKKEIIAFLKPALEETVSKEILSLAYNVTKHFTYEELFPDQT